ncbi:restriction endonuclease subunit S, partial [Shewanella sp. C32]
MLGFDTTVNQSVMALFPNEKLDTKFLFQWYQKVGEEYGISYTQGTKQQSYNAELIKILPFTLPDNVQEQQRVAELLLKLDDLIAANQ